MSFDWRNNPEVGERAHALAADNHSASQIARALNKEFRLGLSRHAVIGRMWRLGRTLNGRPANDPATREARKQEALHRQRAKQEDRLRAEAERRAAMSEAAREAEERARLRREALNPWKMVDTAVLLSQRQTGMCAWPVGESDRPAAQMCCGGPRAEGSSYCRSHRLIGTAATVKASDLVRSVRRYL